MRNNMLKKKIPNSIYDIGATLLIAVVIYIMYLLFAGKI